MTTEDNTYAENPPASDPKPLGFWLRTVDALLSQEFATAFDGTGASRRDWMILNILSGDVDVPGFAERLARKGKRLGGLAERGWVEQQGDGTWTITEEGRAAQARLGEVVEGIRSRVAGAVSPEDFATTLASLEAIARELGWDENASKVRRGFRPGFGPGFGPWRGRGGFPGREGFPGRGGFSGRGGFPGGTGFGPEAGGEASEPVDGEIRDGHGRNRHDGFRPGFGPGGPGFMERPEDGFDPRTASAACGSGHGFGPRGGHRGFEHGHRDFERGHRGSEHGHRGSEHGHRDFERGHRGSEHGHRGEGRGERRGAERAYERGFDAGFARGSAANAASDAV
ncbi:MAG: hypothetical protein ABWY37_00515 [Microbacterium pygmaeum]